MEFKDHFSSQSEIYLGKAPVELIKKSLKDAWADAKNIKDIKWDIVLKVGYKE